MFRFNSNFARLATMVVLLAQHCPAALKPGDTLPAFKAFNLEGAIPDNLKGKVVLLDFWASWCGPCAKSFPAMQELHKKYADRGLVIIAVSVDDKRAQMERFVQRMNISFATARDADQKLVAAADVAAMPTAFLVDRSGKIRFVHVGFFGDETVRQYEEQLERLLKERKP